MALNFQRRETIDFATCTWNPISGCLGPDGKNHCFYCYLKRLQRRYQNDFMTPKFHEDRLTDITKSRKLKNGDHIFVGSSGDMFGEWALSNHILSVLEVVTEHPEYIFIFLTKNPKRYNEFDFPKNAWLGTSIDSPSHGNLDRAVAFRDACEKKANTLFISFEPLLSKITPNFKDLNVKWVIIGANSNEGEPKPPDEWADAIIEKAHEKGIAVWIKNNFKYPREIKEYPTGDCVEMAQMMFNGKEVK